jgi:hypothetical protein
MRQVLEGADDDELVVRVRAGSARGYEYVSSALRIIVRTEDFRRFHIDPQRALKALRIGPDRRPQLVKPIADLAKVRQFIADGYTSQRSPTLFLRARDVGYVPRLCFGGHQDAHTMKRRSSPISERAGCTNGRSVFPRQCRFGLAC